MPIYIKSYKNAYLYYKIIFIYYYLNGVTCTFQRVRVPVRVRKIKYKSYYNLQL